MSPSEPNDIHAPRNTITRRHIQDRVRYITARATDISTILGAIGPHVDGLAKSMRTTMETDVARILRTCEQLKDELRSTRPPRRKRGKGAGK